jgi:hypothetical protein
MQGFAADIFTGGKNERSAHGWTGLRDRWRGPSHPLIADLALIWERYETEFRRWSHPHKPPEMVAEGIRPLLDILLTSGVPGAEVFGAAIREFKGDKAARKTNRMLRAYVENAALLKPRGFSYRSYLRSIVPSAVPPRGDVLQPEAIWVAIIDRDFHNVGPRWPTTWSAIGSSGFGSEARSTGSQASKPTACKRGAWRRCSTSRKQTWRSSNIAEHIPCRMASAISLGSLCHRVC